MASKAMIVLSVVSVVLTLTLHHAGSRGPARLISFELAERNPLAWLLVTCLVAVASVLVRHLVARGYVLRPLLLTLALPCLGTIAATPPQTALHTAAFVMLVAGGGAWFLLMAVEIGKHGLLAASAIAAIVLPLLGVFAPGIAQKLFVLYALSAANVVDSNLDRLDSPISWRT